MKDSHTTLISYQPSWKNKFEVEKVKLKEKLLQDDPTGKDLYISGKSEFVGKVLKLAKKI